MGGKALKDLGSRRVESNRARGIGATVCAALDEILVSVGCELKSHLTRPYRTKVDYGDLDILLPKEFVDVIGHRALVERLGAALGTDLPFFEPYANSNDFHTGIALEEGGCLQVDLLPVPVESFEFAKSYYAYNDLSKLFTLLAKEMNGLSFGNDGLSRSIKADGRVLGTVILTQDYSEALTFLGYDAARYEQGFDTLNDMFEFAASHPKFNTRMYQLENRSNKGRSQDRKRVTYQAFLAWMKERQLTEYDWSQDKTDWLQKALDHFPGARRQYDALFDRQARSERLKGRYNGYLVASMTGLKHESLGLFMEAFKKFKGEKTFQDWIEATSDRDIQQAVQSYHRVYRELPKSGIEVPAP